MKKKLNKDLLNYLSLFCDHVQNISFLSEDYILVGKSDTMNKCNHSGIIMTSASICSSEKETKSLVLLSEVRVPFSLISRSKNLVWASFLYLWYKNNLSRGSNMYCLCLQDETELFVCLSVCVSPCLFVVFRDIYRT